MAGSGQVLTNTTLESNQFCDKFVSFHSTPSKWITLNVGGKLFTTTVSTLTEKEPTCMLARMFAPDSNIMPSDVDKDGAYLIDRSPTYFEPVLNYLRHGQLIYDNNINPEGILEEARFFGMDGLISKLEDIVKYDSKRTGSDMILTRLDVVKALIQTSQMSELRFQGVNLTGCDLSRLDLRHINFKVCTGNINYLIFQLEFISLIQYARLHRCNLQYANLNHCILERADLSYSNLEGAQLTSVRGLCANMEGANLQQCNFEDPLGPSKTLLEGVNLKGACLEGSNMAGVNLRVACLRNANLKNCNLRAAILAGADLERCNLSGSDLQEANLRGANFKDAELELMLTPLHMSQAIR